MRALFIGLGSIGKRHLGIFRGLVPGLEALAWRSGEGAQVKGVKSFARLEQALQAKPNFAVVANPTSLHVKTCLALAGAGVPFLVEKPVACARQGLDELAALAAQKNLPVLVGFQLRYHPGFLQAMDWLKQGRIGRALCLSARVGQWLPDWRPDQDYRESYSAKPEMGGGVIFDLSHELDLAAAFMGPAVSVGCIKAKVSSLEIQTEDLAEITLDHGRALSQIHLDYLQRGYERELRITGEKGSIHWDYAAGRVSLFLPGREPETLPDPPGFERNHMFRAQAAHWLKVLAKEEAPRISLEQGIMTTRLALAAHRASEQRKVVAP